MAVTAAIERSAIIIMRLRFHLSTNGPMNGPITTCGNIPINIATASTVAEPVVLVRYQASANCTRLLPSSDTAWLVQSTKKSSLASLFSPSANRMHEVCAIRGDQLTLPDNTCDFTAVGDIISRIKV